MIAVANMIPKPSQCKKEAYEQNAAQLNKERTQVIRI